MLGPPHVRGGVHHRLDDLVVSGAAAEVARQPVADLGLAGIGVSLEQGPGRHEESGRADAALQGGVLEELLLQGVQGLARRHALDGLDPPPAHLAAQHEARADQPPVQGDAAGPAVAGGAALLAAGQVQRVAEDVEQGLLRLAEELDLVPVHGGCDVVLGHQFALARSSAIRAARRASTPASSIRNCTVPRLSSIGRHAARAAASSRSWAGRSRALPTMARAASGTSRTFSATAARATRARVTAPEASMARLTPAPTTAMSISVRGMKRRYASLARFSRAGSRKEATSSPLASESLRGPIITSSTGTSRRPAGPTTVATAPAAMRAGTLSAAGEPLHRLPPRVARPWTCVDPMRLAASITPGQTFPSVGCSLSSAPVTAAPTRNPPRSSTMERVSRIFLMSTMSSGSRMSERIWTRRSVPPASTRASPLALASRATASSSVSGASYRMWSFRSPLFGWAGAPPVSPDPAVAVTARRRSGRGAQTERIGELPCNVNALGRPPFALDSPGPGGLGWGAPRALTPHMEEIHDTVRHGGAGGAARPPRARWLPGRPAPRRHSEEDQGHGRHPDRLPGELGALLVPRSGSQAAGLLRGALRADRARGAAGAGPRQPESPVG